MQILGSGLKILNFSLKTLHLCFIDNNFFGNSINYKLLADGLMNLTKL